MRDLEDRLHGVDRVSLPRLDWRDIERRALEVEAPTSPWHRAAPALVAATIAVLATLLVVRAFGGFGDRPAGGLRPNGMIVFTDQGPAPADIPFDNIDAYAWDPSTGERVNLTDTPTVAERSLSWSPDHSRVVFMRTTATGSGGDFRTLSDLVVADADFSDQRVIRSCEDGCAGWLSVAWSPDANRLAIALPLQATKDGFTGWVSGLVTYEFATGETRTICDTPTECGQPGQPEWSPDGTQIAYSNAGSMISRGLTVPAGPIWVADVSTGKVHALTGAAKCSLRPSADRPCVFDSSPQWAEDGRTIVFVRETRSDEAPTKALITIDVDGTGERTLTTCDAGDQCMYYELTMSPDGTHVAFPDRYDRSSILVVDVTTGDATSFTLPSGAELSELAWSPDASSIAVLAGGRRADLAVIHPESGEVETPLPQATSQGDLEWLSEGAVTAPKLQSEAVTTSASTAQPVPPAGTIVFSSSSGSAGEEEATEIWSIDTDGSGLTQLTDNSAMDIDPALSPDGTMIAFTSSREGDRNIQIYVMNADGSDQRVLTDRRTGATQPSWSPDGSTIAFVSGAGWGEPGGVFVVEIEGGEPWIVAEGNAFAPTWSNDGRSVIYALSGDERDGFWTAPIRTIDCIPGPCSGPPGIATELFGLPGWVDEPALSPDGTTLAFTWSAGSSGAIFTSRLDGEALQKVAVGNSPTWSPDGRWLAFTHTDDVAGPQIWVMRPDGSDAAALTSLPGFIPGTQVYGITRDPSWGP